MNNQRREVILRDIDEYTVELQRVQEIPVNKDVIPRTIPADILAPVCVFVRDQLRISMQGAWLSLPRLREGFLAWLKAIGKKESIVDYSTMIQFGRCLGQALQQRSERRRIKGRQVRGFPVWPRTDNNGEDFWPCLYE